SVLHADLERMSGGHMDKELTGILIGKSYETIQWMVGHGHHLEPAVSLSGVKVDGKIKWPKGAVIRTEHEGVGLSAHWFERAETLGCDVLYEHAAISLLQDEAGRVTGVKVATPDGHKQIGARSVILACGGFEANSAMRGQYLGKPWDNAKVRGTKH